MLLYVTIFLVCGFYLLNGQTTDYCDPTLCPAGVLHIACNNTGEFSSNCPIGNTTLVPLSCEQATNILDLHNQLRAKIASGLVVPYPPAVRMQTLQWNRELANLAKLNVKQCEMKHDKCRNTATLKWCGQNLASAWTSVDTFDISLNKLITGGINSWFDENIYANVSIVNSFASTTPKSGHFTAMIQDKSNQVGCAISVYVKPTGANFLLACNYGFTNILNQPIYVTGPTCSGCKSGCSTKYPGLCNKNENVSAIPLYV